MQYANLIRQIAERGFALLVFVASAFALNGANAASPTLGKLEGTVVAAEDVSALFARNGKSQAETAKFTNLDQGKELIRALMLVMWTDAHGVDVMRLSQEERARIKLVTAKSKLDSLMEISDQRVDEAAKANPQQYDHRIKEIYDTTPQQFLTPKRVKAAHILIRTEKRTVIEAAKLADEITTRARNGESFETLAKQYSDDEGSKDQGGLLGEYADSKKGTNPIETAAFWSKKEHGVADPVLGRTGVHIVKILSETPAGRASLSDATPAIRSTLIAQQKVEERKKWSQILNAAVSNTEFNEGEIEKLVAPPTTSEREKIETALKLLGIGPYANDPPKPDNK